MKNEIMRIKNTFIAVQREIRERSFLSSSCVSPTKIGTVPIGLITEKSAAKMYWLSFLFLMLSGIFDGISVVIRGTIVQLKTPDHIRGRVMSANSIFIMSSNEMGQFESGVAAKLLGVVRSVVFGGTMTVLIALFVGKFVPKLRKMEY